jgi:hypothetical protein
MALFIESDLRARADRSTPFQKSASNVLTEKVLGSVGIKEFDIFLSHSFSDQKLILGIWLSLEDMGYKVYVDWIHDRQLSRETVNKETASVLRFTDDWANPVFDEGQATGSLADAVQSLFV